MRTFRYLFINDFGSFRPCNSFNLILFSYTRKARLKSHLVYALDLSTFLAPNNCFFFCKKNYSADEATSHLPLSPYFTKEMGILERIKTRNFWMKLWHDDLFISIFITWQIKCSTIDYILMRNFERSFFSIEKKNKDDF